jgi:C4-dicarboxylate-specific signal transduction histidine kinase
VTERTAALQMANQSLEREIAERRRVEDTLRLTSEKAEQASAA